MLSNWYNRNRAACNGQYVNLEEPSNSWWLQMKNLSLVAGMALAANVGLAQADSCQLYGVNDEGLNNSQFFTVNPHTLEVKTLGEMYKAHDIEALDAHPGTDVLYAASGDDTANPGHLYTVNTQTGALTDLGSTGFAEIEGLTFHANGSLWAWAKGEGLISIDPQSGPNGTLVLSFPEQIEDLTWNNEGTLLYASQDTNLWVADGHSVKKACGDLPGHTEALEMLPDGSLLLGIHGEEGIIQFQAINLETCEIVFGMDIPALW